MKIKSIEISGSYSWNSLCAKLGTKCWSEGILEIWNFEETTINNLTQQKILDDVNSIVIRYVFTVILQTVSHSSTIYVCTNALITLSQLFGSTVALTFNSSSESMIYRGLASTCVTHCCNKDILYCFLSKHYLFVNEVRYIIAFHLSPNYFCVSALHLVHLSILQRY